MNRIVKLLVVGLFILLPVLAVSSSVYAVDVINDVCSNGNATTTPEVCKDNNGTSVDPLLGSEGVLTKAINITSAIAGIIAVFVIIIAGVKMIVSSGDSNTIASARRTILYGAISLAVVGSAQLIVHFVLSKLNL